MSRRIIQDIQGKITKISSMVERISYYLEEIEANEPTLVEEYNISCQFEGKLLRLPPNIRIVNENDKKE